MRTLCARGPFTHLKYNRPVSVDAVAVDFPKITFILSHLGKPWVDEALAIARKNSNVYLDFAAWDDYYLRRPLHLVETIAKVKNYCGLDKVLFGTDWPVACIAGVGEMAKYRRSRSADVDHLQELDALSVMDWVNVVKNIETPEVLLQLGYSEITEEDKRMMLSENAARILNL